VAALLLGGVVVLAVLAGSFLTGAARTVALVLLGVVALPALGGVVTALVRLAGRGARLELTSDGFRNRTALLGIGVRDAAWTEVLALRAMRDVLVVDLSEGRRSLVDARVLGLSPDALGKRLRLHVGRPFQP
jgi:hypothetical protein